MKIKMLNGIKMFNGITKLQVWFSD